MKNDLRSVAVDLADDLAAWLEAINPHCAGDYNESQALLARARDAIATHDKRRALWIGKQITITSMAITVGLAIGVGMVLNMPHDRCNQRPIASLSI